MKAQWEECYEKIGGEAYNYSFTECYNCPHAKENDPSCEMKRANRRAREAKAERIRECTNWNAN